MNPEEHALVVRLQAGEESAFREFVDTFRDRVITVIARVAGGGSEAEDLAQETFLKAFRAIGRFQGQSALFTWLYRIAVNTTRDHLDARRRRPAVALDALGGDDEDAWNPPGDDPTPLQTLETNDMRALVRSAMEQLPEPFRSTLVLREMEGHAYEEIARILDVSIGTVESRIFRARARLRAILERELARR